jgi:transposase
MRKTSERRRGGDEREREMFRLRTVDGLTLSTIAARFGVGPERVRQLINRHVRETTGLPPDTAGLSRAAKATRRADDLARAQAHAHELIAAWREGEDPQRLARAFGLRVRCVSEVIRTNATNSDRAARTSARRLRARA